MTREVRYLVVGTITDEEAAMCYGPACRVGDPEWRLLDHFDRPGSSADFPTREAAIGYARDVGWTVVDRTGADGAGGTDRTD